MNKIPETGFLRLKQIIGDKTQGVPPIIPVGRSSWLEGVKLGIYPKPVRLGVRMQAWYADDIRDLVNKLNNAQ